MMVGTLFAADFPVGTLARPVRQPRGAGSAVEPTETSATTRGADDFVGVMQGRWNPARPPSMPTSIG
jgi:hypothetical protein